MEPHGHRAVLVRQRPDGHVRAVHTHRPRGRQFDIVQPSDSTVEAALVTHLHLLGLRACRSRQGDRTGLTAVVVIFVLRNSYRFGGRVECGCELRRYRSVTCYIHHDRTLLRRQGIRGGEGESALRAVLKLLTVERATAAGHAAAVNEVDAVFVVYLQHRITRYVRSCAADRLSCRRC